MSSTSDIGWWSAGAPPSRCRSSEIFLEQPPLRPRRVQRRREQPRRALELLGRRARRRNDVLKPGLPRQLLLQLRGITGEVLVNPLREIRLARAVVNQKPGEPPVPLEPKRERREIKREELDRLHRRARALAAIGHLKLELSAHQVHAARERRPEQRLHHLVKAALEATPGLGVLPPASRPSLRHLAQLLGQTPRALLNLLERRERLLGVAPEPLDLGERRAPPVQARALLVERVAQPSVGREPLIPLRPSSLELLTRGLGIALQLGDHLALLLERAVVAAGSAALVLTRRRRMPSRERAPSLLREREVDIAIQ